MMTPPPPSSALVNNPLGPSLTWTWDQPAVMLGLLDTFGGGVLCVQISARRLRRRSDASAGVEASGGWGVLFAGRGIIILFL